MVRLNKVFRGHQRASKTNTRMIFHLRQPSRMRKTSREEPSSVVDLMDPSPDRCQKCLCVFENVYSIYMRFAGGEIKLLSNPLRLLSCLCSLSFLPCNCLSDGVLGQRRRSVTEEISSYTCGGVQARMEAKREKLEHVLAGFVPVTFQTDVLHTTYSEVDIV